MPTFTGHVLREEVNGWQIMTPDTSVSSPIQVRVDAAAMAFIHSLDAVISPPVQRRIFCRFTL